MTYRIIYSLQFDLVPGPGGALRQLIIPLCADGTATNIQPVPPKIRVIDLRAGDQFIFRGTRETVTRIQAYRDSFTDVAPPAQREGYVYECSAANRRE